MMCCSFFNTQPTKPTSPRVTVTKPTSLFDLSHRLQYVADPCVPAAMAGPASSFCFTSCHTRASQPTYDAHYNTCRLIFPRATAMAAEYYASSYREFKEMGMDEARVQGKLYILLAHIQKRGIKQTTSSDQIAIFVSCSFLLPGQGIPPRSKKTLSPGVGGVRAERGLASASLGRGAVCLGFQRFQGFGQAWVKSCLVAPIRGLWRSQYN